jgi:hypothetical protein
MEMANAPRFKVIEGWEKLPAGYVHKDVDGVAVDSQDNVYLMTRQDARLIVYDRDGNFLRSWGEGLFTQRTHGVCVGPDDMVYAVDDGDHTVRKFTPEGKQVMMIGVSGKTSVPVMTERPTAASHAAESPSTGRPMPPLRPTERFTSPTAMATPGYTALPPTGSSSSPGGSRGRDLASSACRTGSESRRTTVFS